MAIAYDALVDGCAAASCLIFVGMSVWVSYDVVLRYLFAAPTIWADDLSEYGLIWGTFLAAPWVLRNGGHVSVELLINYLPAESRRRLAVVVALLCAVICALFAWQTALTTIEFYQRNMMMAKVWRIPLWLPYLAIPVGSALLAVEFLVRASRFARGDAALAKADTGRV